MIFLDNPNTINDLSFLICTYLFNPHVGRICNKHSWISIIRWPTIECISQKPLWICYPLKPKSWPLRNVLHKWVSVLSASSRSSCYMDCCFGIWVGITDLGSFVSWVKPLIAMFMCPNCKVNSKLMEKLLIKIKL